jgi:outer membrane translocation and assembly module TamA
MTKGSRYVIDSIIIALPDNSKHVKTFKTPSTEAFSILNIVTVKEELKSYSENGYPFVNLSLDDIHWKDSVASIRWHIEKGPLMKMDSLYLRSDDRIPRAYLTRALQWQKGKHYRESIIQQADGRIREIPFLSNLQPSSLRFTADGAQLITYPVRKPSNTFQGILGIRPDDRTGKINLTGDVELRLWNGLNTGEELYINWRKLQSQTQDLEAKVVFNYLFGTSFGPETNIKIYKRDSTFVSIRLNGGIGWKPNFHTTLKGFAERLNTNTLRPSLLFPEVTNVSAVYYGISYIHSAYDNIGNPRKGILIRGEISRGYRTKEIYNAADSSNISNRYDAAKYELEMKLYIPTFKKQCLLMGTYSGSIQSDSLAQNELYRIGGIRTMRGIDEESILTSSFSITTVEYRYLLDTQTAVYLFMEHSWWENRSDLKYIKDSPISFGAGLNLKTSSGIFTFNYALGQQFNNPVQVRNAKVSFGFKSVF